MTSVGNNTKQGDESDSDAARQGERPLVPLEKQPKNHVTESSPLVDGSGPTISSQDKVFDLSSEQDGGELLERGAANSYEEEAVDSEDIVAPDGGWGWVVCFGAFAISFVVDGTTFSFGVLMLELVSALGEDQSTTAWIGSVQLGILMIMGPVVSILLQKYSIRQVVVLGALLGFFAFVVSVFAPNVAVLILTYGVVGGVGLGLVFLPSLIILVSYFNKRRAIATGIATSGTGFGTFAYAWFMDILLENFSWRGTVLILGGFVLNCVAFGLLFRPLPTATSKQLNVSKDSDKLREDMSSEQTKVKASGSLPEIRVNNTKQSSASLDVIPPPHVADSSCDTSADQPQFSDFSGQNCPKFQYEPVQNDFDKELNPIDKTTLTPVSLNSDSKSREDLTRNCNEKTNLCPAPLGQFWHLEEKHPGKFSVNRIFSSADHINTLSPGLAESSSGRDDENHHSNSHLQQPDGALLSDIASPKLAEIRNNQSVSLYGINGYNSQHPHHSNKHHYNRNHHHTHPHSYYHLGGSRVEKAGRLRNGRSSHSPRGSSTHLAAFHHFGSMSSFGAAITHASNVAHGDEMKVERLEKTRNCCCVCLNQFFPQALLQDTRFLFLLLGFISWTAQTITMTYLPAYAVSLGIERTRAAYLISIIGIANVVGRPVAGLITDCLSIPSIWLYSCALVLGAAANFGFTLCSSYYLLAACAGTFGFCMGVVVSMRTIVLAEQMGVESLTESFGVVALFQGISFTVWPPIAGGMIDEFESSRPPFWLTAGMYSIAAICTLCAGWLNKKHAGKEIL